MARAVIDIGADTADYVAKVKTIPGLTEKEADKAGKAFRSKLINQALKGLDEVGEAAEDAVKKTGQATDKLGNQLLDLGELVGVPGDKLKKLGAGVGALASPAGIAAVAVGGIAAAATGVAVGITSAVAAADDLARSLEEVKGLTAQEGFGITPAQLKSIDEANAAMSALGVIGKQAVVTLGAEFAPAVRTVAVELVKLGLVGLDAINTFADGENVLRAVAEFLTGRMVKAITAPINSLTLLTETMAKVADVAGADGLAASLHSVNDAYEGWVDSMADRAVDGLGAGIARLSATTADYQDDAEALIGTIARHAEAERNAVQATKDRAAAEREAAQAAREAEQAELARIRALEQLIGEYGRVEDAQEDAARGSVARAEREIATVDDLAARLAASGELTVEREQVLASRKAQIAADYAIKVVEEERKRSEEERRLHEERMAQIKAERDARIAAVTTATSQALAAVDSLADAEYQRRTENARAIEERLADTEHSVSTTQRMELEDRLELEKKQAKRSFALSKALSLAQIAVSTAEASMAAFAQGMKVGGPVGAAALLAATLAVGGLQATLVAKQKPPVAHRGRVPLAGGTADEQITTVLSDEAVLTGRGVDAAGGPSGVADLNAGRSSGGGAMSINLVLGNRTLERVTFEALRRPGQARRAARANSPTGQRRRM